MIRTLYISTARAVEVNAALVHRAAASVAARGSPSSSLGSPAELDIFVHVHDRSRATFLLHAQHLYGAALDVTPALQADIVPMLTEVTLSGQLETESGLPTATTTAAEMDESAFAALYTAASAPLAEQGRGASSEHVALWTAAAMAAEQAAGFVPLYRYVAVGGTFDHLHAGHKLLLTTAALHASEKLRCGVTGEALLTKKKFAERLQPIEERKAGAMAFLRKVRPDLEVDMVTITDIGGGSDTIAEIEALALSPETGKALAIINDLRAKNGGLRPLEGIHIPFVKTRSGDVISSTAIRQRFAEGGQ